MGSLMHLQSTANFSCQWPLLGHFISAPGSLSSSHLLAGDLDCSHGGDKVQRVRTDVCKTSVAQAQNFPTVTSTAFCVAKQGTRRAQIQRLEKENPPLHGKGRICGHFCNHLPGFLVYKYKKPYTILY